jgi:uncharacterized protein (DUF433 family)
MSPEKYKYIGNGIYSIRDVAKFAKVSPRSVKRWLLGYKYRQHDEVMYSEPIIKSDYADINDIPMLSFADLVEISFIDAFRKLGVSWNVIKMSSQRAIEIIGYTHPFSTKRFHTDGKKILMEIADSEEEVKNTLMDLINDQYAIKKVLEPYLYKGLEFDNDIANRWWPLGKEKSVVLDPERNFGKPIVSKESVPTWVIYKSYLAEGSLKKVSFYYNVSFKSIKDSIEFEKNLAA